MPTLWDERYAQRTQRMTSSAIRELLKLTEQSEVISFAGGLPAPEVFPLAQVATAAQHVLKEQGEQALQYSTTEGYRPLREMIAGDTARLGINVTADNILITTGSQQALDLLGKILIDPGDSILVEAPTYLGALQAWNVFGANYLTVPLDGEGMRIDTVEDALRAGVKFVYALPNFQNPTGVTLALERRRPLVAVASRYGAAIVEDDPYGQLRYEGKHLPPLLVLDHEHRRGDSACCYNGNVIYLSTFSKTLAPGLRLGWVIAPPEVIHKMVQAKQGADLHTATLTQMIAYEVARGGFLDRHVQTIRAVYRERRDTMLAALAREFPPSVQWTHPQGGLFLWVTLPESMNAAHLLELAVAERVAFVPGAPFFPTGGGANTLRLNFSNATPPQIAEGIRRLGRVLRREISSGIFSSAAIT